VFHPWLNRFYASASDFTNLPARLTQSFDFPFSAISLPCDEFVLEIYQRQFCVRVFGVVRGSPHPASGHLLPIRCGEGLI
jgi:hypothetical protein